MSLSANAVLNGYAIALLALLLAYSFGGGRGRSRQQGLYLSMLSTTMLLLVLDTLSRFDGLAHPAFPAINWTGNLLVFLFTPFLPSLWVMYVYCVSKNEGGLPRAARIALIALNAVNFFMVIASQYTGWYYTIDAANIYHRGPVYPFHHLITLILLGWAYWITWRNKRNIDQRVLFSLLVFPVPSLIGSLLQALFYSYAFALVAALPALLIVLLYAQDDSIYNDYLTGVGNRKKLEEVLKEKVARSSQRRTFSFVMLDIDNFKTINDTLGHEMGDNVLKTAAGLLKKCVRSNDYVTRYGGDEFCLILDVSSNPALTRVISRLNAVLEMFNRSGELPVRLSFSMGWSVYDYDERLEPEAFLKRVDLLMYEDKRTKILARKLGAEA